MRRFLIIGITLGLLAFSAYYASSRLGFYVHIRPAEPAKAVFRASGRALERRTQDGTWEALVLRGVDLYSSMPECYATDFAPEYRDYLRWMTAIGEMGANAVRALNVMDDDFYHALYAYNTSHEQPLYLLQGTTIPDMANYGEGDAYQSGFQGQLMRDGMTLVDIVHGRKVIDAGGTGGSGVYRWDLSEWVLGYLVGSEWSEDTIAYTNHHAAYSGAYSGRFFRTAEDAQPFEAMLAEIMDTITGYESDKYGEQRPIAFINDPKNDPFEYADTYAQRYDKYAYISAINSETYARQLGKFNQLDAEHILPTQENRAGCFAAYRLYSFCPNFEAYLSDAERERLADELAAMDRSRSFGGYLDLLGMYHTMPVVAAGYGLSTSRGVVTDLYGGPMTEEEQGRGLMAIDRDLALAGWSGGFISGWQDQWERRSWNTAYAQQIAANIDWKDVQTEGQGYGLMEFETHTCEVDGDPSEWAKAKPIYEGDGPRLFAMMDSEGLCLLIEGVKRGETWYLPIDVTPDSGSYVCREPKLAFDRAADFLLVLEGDGESRLLVQARYESVRENFLFEISGVNPFVYYPEKDESRFVPILMAIENFEMIDAEQYINNTGRKRLRTYETGTLREGNNSPASEDYDSLADYCYGRDCVEVRLPWGLLNFADPTDLLIHADYYEHYGVRPQRAKSVYIGIGNGEEAIPMAEYRLKWPNVPVRERLKRSYGIIQAVWTAER